MPDSRLLVVKQHEQARSFLLAFKDGLTVAFVCYSPVAQEYAGRLASCWNACEGIPTEILEQSKPGDALFTIMQEQRDRSNEALLALLAARAIHGPFSQEYHDAARSAIELLATMGVNVVSERERGKVLAADQPREERQHKESKGE